jgi:uncharacterized protein (DUF736 family)
MAVIGVFYPTKDGGWSGTIRTLFVDAKLRFVPNDNQENDSAPAFRAFVGEYEVGAAWIRQSTGSPSRSYLSVRLDDPMLSRPLFAAMFEQTERSEAHLVWTPTRDKAPLDH